MCTVLSKGGPNYIHVHVGALRVTEPLTFHEGEGLFLPDIHHRILSHTPSRETSTAPAL